MKLKASLLFASRLIFPRTGKKSNARKSLIGACACIAISLVPLVMVMTVSNGMIQGITDRIIGLSSNHIQCHVYNSMDYILDSWKFDAICDGIADLNKVKAVYPEIQGIGLASSLKGRTGATIRAVRADSFKENQAFVQHFKILDGKADLSSINSVIIGEKMAKDLGVKAGSTIRLITTREISVNDDGVETEGLYHTSKTVPKITPLKVSAVVSCGYQELDALWLFISLETGRKIMSSQSSSVIIGIQTENPYGIELEEAFSQLKPVLSDIGRLYKWNQLNSAQYENFASTRIMLIFIMMLIVLVASVNISSALVMLVIERKKEIAIIKSLGGTSQGIAFSFVLTGLFAGLAGVITGIPLGLFISVNFNKIMNIIEKILNSVVDFAFLAFSGNSGYNSQIHLLDPAFYLQDIPLSVPLDQLLIIACGTLVLSLFVSAIPAVKAGKEKPIDTLRKI